MYQTTRSDRWLFEVLRLVSGVALLLVPLIFLFIGREAWPFLREVGLSSLWMSASWNPTEGLFQILPMVGGSLLVTLGAILLSLPLSLLTAAFCRMHAGSVWGAFYLLFVQVMAGIPSVVFGFWGLVTLLPLINKIRAPGASLLAGIIILSLMILPTMVLMLHSRMQKIPSDSLRAAQALGLDRWGQWKAVIFPQLKTSFFSSTILAGARAIGETMAVIMVCGNVVQWPQSLFDPIRTLTANIALEMAYARDLHRSVLFASGLVFMVMIAFMVAAVNRLEGGGDHV